MIYKKKRFRSAICHFYPKFIYIELVVKKLSFLGSASCHFYYNNQINDEHIAKSGFILGFTRWHFFLHDVLSYYEDRNFFFIETNLAIFILISFLAANQIFCILGKILPVPTTFQNAPKNSNKSAWTITAKPVSLKPGKGAEMW